ncbi:MAG: hypothetical protein SAK29_26550 [Scytonema sp. PMC 1069.18]|nr:hypothetical protein [Scytonema sp. PMC 1069.18]MEC4884131.1 hypothetical protein [Scytonema sp. PMC 1070.18]
MMPNNHNQAPSWQPLSKLPLLAQMIDEGLTYALEQYQKLQKAQNLTHPLDDQTVERILKVFAEQQEIMWVYTEQVSKWKTENLDATQKQEIDKLETQLSQMENAIADILSLTNQLKQKST